MSSSLSESPPRQPNNGDDSLWKSSAGSWNRFWFTPADPTLLGMMRICVGLLAIYTLIAYTWDLQLFFGKDAWLNLDLRARTLKESPITISGLAWPKPVQYPSQLTEAQQKYAKEYFEKWKEMPPLPFPENNAEEEAIDRYRAYWNVDPRLVYAKGTTEWSIWFHVTDPDNMLLIHYLFLFVACLFTIGFATRITSVLLWFGSMCYLHRAPISLFGFDTMMQIMLLYLMIGPSGAVFSVDKCMRDWWRKRRAKSNRSKDASNSSVGSREEARRIQSADDPARRAGANRSVMANIAIRLLQIHVCIIYASAGLAKLQGAAWWDGTAIWRTLGNSEFAPMQSEAYSFLLREMASNLLFLQMFLAAGTYFTLFFEIAYPFMIWGKRTRWVMLFMAAVLHGVIGLLMGLKTFALIMLVMNAAFLPPVTVQWIAGLFRRPFSDPTGERQRHSPPGTHDEHPIGRENVSQTSASSVTHVQEKK